MGYSANRTNEITYNRNGKSFLRDEAKTLCQPSNIFGAPNYKGAVIPSAK